MALSLGLGKVDSLSDVVAACGGTLGLTTADEQLTTLWLEWPVRRLVDAHPPRFSGRALVIDSQAQRRQSLMRLLQHWGMACEGVGVGFRGLGRLHRALAVGRAFDLVVIDQALSDMKGMALARMIRSEVSFTSTPLLLVQDEPLPPALAQDGTIERVGGFWRRQALHETLVRLREASTTQPRGDLGGALRDQRHHIMVVEDSRTSLRLLKAMLEDLGFTPVLSSRGDDALQLLRQTSVMDLPSAILMDCGLPGPDGFATTTQIRALPPPRGTLPVIALTAYDDDATRARARQAGMNDFLTKPVAPAVLRACLKRWLRPVQSHTTPSAPLQRPREPTSVGLDMQALEELRLMGHGEDVVLTEVLQHFLVELPLSLETLRQGVADMNMDSILHVTHALKSACRSVGAIAMGAQSERIEAMAQVTSRDQLTVMLRHFEAEAQHVTQALEMILERSRTRGA